MTNRKLPELKLPRATKPTILSSGSKKIIPANMFQGRKYDILHLNHQKKDESDKVQLPKINDMVINMKKTEENTKEKNFRCSKALERRRTKMVEQIANLKKEWSSIEINENSLRKNMIIFNRFLKQNLIKRERVGENMKQYRGIRLKYEEQMETIKGKIAVMKQVRYFLRYQLDKHAIYYNFLNDMTSFRAEFKSVSSLVSTYELLFNTLQGTAEIFRSRKSEMENLTVKLEAKNVENIHLIESLQHRLGTLQEEYAKAILNSQEKERVLLQIREESASLNLQLANTKEVINQLYMSICERKGVQAVFEKEDYNSQLVVIHNVINMFQRIFDSLEKSRVN